MLILLLVLGFTTLCDLVVIKRLDMLSNFGNPSPNARALGFFSGN